MCDSLLEVCGRESFVPKGRLDAMPGHQVESTSRCQDLAPPIPIQGVVEESFPTLAQPLNEQQLSAGNNLIYRLCLPAEEQSY